MKFHNYFPSAISILLLLTLPLCNVHAAPITILNHSFEEPPLADTVWNLTIPDWSLVTGAGQIGVWNIPYQTLVTTEAPDGTQVGYAHGATIGQVLSASLLVDTTYTLTMEAAYSGCPGSCPAMSLGLFAGGDLLSEAIRADGALNDDVFQAVTTTFTATSGHLNLGDALEVRLMSAGPELMFDNFQLDASPVPVPAAAWLFGSALLGLGVVKRKKA